MSMRRLTLTDLKLDVTRGVKRAALTKVIQEFGLEAKWGQTSWARRTQRATRRAQLTDFDRFKVMVLKQRRRVLTNTLLKNRK